MTTSAIAIDAAALVSWSTVLFLRWFGMHWTWTLPGVRLGRAALRWHRMLLRHESRGATNGCLASVDWRTRG